MPQKRRPDNRSVHVSVELHKRLLAHYNETGDFMSDVVDHAVTEYLDRVEGIADIKKYLEKVEAEETDGRTASDDA